VFYVFGGRDGSGNPLDTVQKYFPETYGVEDMYPIFFDPATGQPAAQFVNAQTDIWSDGYQFHDYDWMPQQGEAVNPPIVPERPPGNELLLNPLPEPLYGHAAVTLESTGNVFPPPVWPEGPYCYVFISGGINDGGVPVNAVRWFNVWAEPSERQQDEDPRPGDYSIVTEMPIERAYHSAFVTLPDKLTDKPWRMVIVGGFDRNGNYISQVDEYTFDSITNPVTGTWRTVANTSEAAAGTGAGWQVDERGMVYTQFGGRTVDGYTGSVFDVLSNGSMSLAPSGLVPRGWAGTTSVRVYNDFLTSGGDFYIVGGLTQMGMDTIVEHYRP
jgi:hypothetical protein